MPVAEVTVGYTHGGSAADILTEADAAACGLSVAEFATAVVARLTSDRSGNRVLEWSNAGHPPVLLVRGDGTVDLLAERPDLPLGIGRARSRSDHTVRLGPEDAILLYTDGLVERVDEDIDTGLARLCAAVAGVHDQPLERICDIVVETQRGRRDDIALLAARPHAATGATGAPCTPASG
jgi:serine phosphatase RsbU (regulator of sigma subunit)